MKTVRCLLETVVRRGCSATIIRHPDGRVTVRATAPDGRMTQATAADALLACHELRRRLGMETVRRPLLSRFVSHLQRALGKWRLLRLERASRAKAESMA